MSTIVRQCARCGHFDSDQRWPSLDAAAAAGATEQGWACPRCGWAEFTLVEESAAPIEPQARGASPERGGTHRSALDPVDPDEARRRVQQILPFR